jgi:aspartyl-tRNA(Asn)/glutamyl-tRNA(Gln) amidotransferase subunit A
MAISTSNLYEMTVSEMADAVAKGMTTPIDLVESSLERIAAIEPRLQAWSFLDVEGARAQAAQLTAEAAAGKLRGPLHGVPVGVKDQFNVKGMPTGLRGRGPEPEDATVVARLRAAGAVVMGKTHMHIRGMLPPTCNPWNTAHTPGSSSSGSGAGVGARMVPVALAEQTSGSGLRPAGYCGVAGFVATFGRISRHGMYPLSWSLDLPALIGLTIDDIALVYSVIGGPDPLDSTSLMEPMPRVELKASERKPPRIGIVSNFFPERTDLVMQEAIEKAGSRLRDAGAQVVNIALPEEFGLTWDAYRLISGAEAANLHASLEGEKLGDTKLRDAGFVPIPATYYLQALRIRRWISEKVQVLFKDVDTLLMGVARGPAPKGIHSVGDPTLLRPWSCLGYPAITLSGGLSPSGLPLGLQFVGAPKQESELLRVGSWCEKGLGRLPMPPIQ